MIYGADFSSLEEVESCGGVFKEHGKPNDLTAILSNAGINGARLRIWVDPFGSDGKSYGAGTCDTECVLRLMKRAKAQGMKTLLDFHYSDYWCDPAKQFIPKAWRGLNLDEMCVKLHDYTLNTLLRFKAEGVYPDMVQVGNEITNGLLWPVGQLSWNDSDKTHGNFESLCALLKAGCSAVRESGDAKIMLHLEDSGNNLRWVEWFEHIIQAGIDFDIIGASYYPIWHGSLNGLENNLNDMARRYGKELHIVETAYPFTMEPYVKGEKPPFSVGESTVLADGSNAPFAYTKEGQSEFLASLTKLAERIHGGLLRGIWYWEPAWIPVKNSSWASEEAREYINETGKPGGNEWANQCLFDYDGNANPALYLFSKSKNR